MTVKISALPAAGSVAGTDEFETNQAGTSRKATAAQIRAGLATSGAVGSSGLTMNTARLLGRTTAASGAVEEISVGTGLTLSGGTLSAGSSNGQLLNVQVFTSSGTYTRTANVTRAVVIARGGGGGGSGFVGGCGGATDGSSGGTTSFGSHVSAAGGGGATATGAAGGTGGTGASLAIRGMQTRGSGSIGGGEGHGGQGGAGVRGGGGGSTGSPAFNNGGGQGEYALKYITSGLNATETVTIGAGGAGGSGASGGTAGGAGGAGYIIVYEYS